MTGEAPGAALLATLAAVDPLYFSSFYRRARLHREVPRPAPATVVLDVTSACPLRCGFCFASGTRGDGRLLRLEQLRALERDLAGVPRVVLVGGEPLAHPALRGLLAELARHHAEIEIHTSGAVLPADPARRRRWLEDRFGGLPARFTLALAVDRFHREQLGPAAFAALVAATVRAPAEAWPVRIRYHVTDEALHSSGYLVPEVVEAVLADLHADLQPAFRAALATRSLDERFSLNPVVRMGAAATGPGELLQAEDALLGREIVLVPDGDDGVALRTFLPAAWMPDPPAPLRPGATRHAPLAALLARHVVAERFEHARFAAAAAAWARLHGTRRPGHAPDPAWAAAAAELRTLGLVQRLRDWPAQRQAWLDGLAQGLAGLCGAGGQAWDLGGGRRVRRLTAPVLRRFLARHLAGRPERAAALIARLAAQVAAPVEHGALPAFTGYAPRPGLLTDAPDEPLPLGLAPLDLGPDVPHLGDALVRPRVVPRMVVDARADVHLELDGVGQVPFGPARSLAEAVEAHARLHGMVAWFLPQALQPELARALAQRLRAGAADAGTTARQVELALRCAGSPPVGVGAEPVETPGQALRLLAGEAAEDLAPLPQVARWLAG